MAKILIVEDEAILANALEGTLVAMGYTVAGIADTGMKAILQFFSTEPDLVLMDIRLKGSMDGIETAERIRSQKAIPIVFLTAHQDPVTFERAKIDGAFGYILKPFQERELQIVIEIALSQFASRKKNAELEAGLLNAEKLGTVGTLSSGIIHDVNGPITMILSALNKLNQAASQDENIKNNQTVTSAIKTAQKGVDAIVDTVKNYRNIIDATASETATSLTILEIAKQTFEVCRYTAMNQKVKFKELSSSTQSKVLCGRTSIFQVLVNLVRNACDAVENQPDAWVQMAWEDLDRDFLKIQIIDSGNGIPENIRDKMFQTLFTTKPPGKGTGLGLNLCRRLLEKFGGTLEIDSTHPNTCFVVKLPKAS